MVAERYTIVGDRSQKVVSIERHLLVGKLMDYQAAVHDALTDCSAAIQYAAGATIEPGALEAIRVLHAQRAGLSALLTQLREHSGEFDGLNAA